MNKVKTATEVLLIMLALCCGSGRQAAGTRIDGGSDGSAIVDGATGGTSDTGGTTGDSGGATGGLGGGLGGDSGGSGGSGGAVDAAGILDAGELADAGEPADAEEADSGDAGKVQDASFCNPVGTWEADCCPSGQQSIVTITDTTYSTSMSGSHKYKLDTIDCSLTFNYHKVDSGGTMYDYTYYLLFLGDNFTGFRRTMTSSPHCSGSYCPPPYFLEEPIKGHRVQ